MILPCFSSDFERKIALLTLESITKLNVLHQLFRSHFLDGVDGIKAGAKGSGGVTASGAVHCHFLSKKQIIQD